MDIRFLRQEEQAEIYPAVMEMLREADHDFVPPLSARSSSVQRDFSSPAEGDGVAAYFEELKRQRFVGIYREGALIAFASYKENYTCDRIGEEDRPNIYLSTLIVRPEARGQGITTAFYRKLSEEFQDRKIFTRTWSTNAAHIRVLAKYDFRPTAVLKDHRGAGIDTVYFKKDPANYAEK